MDAGAKEVAVFAAALAMAPCLSHRRLRDAPEFRVEDVGEAAGGGGRLITDDDSNKST